MSTMCSASSTSFGVHQEFSSLPLKIYFEGHDNIYCHHKYYHVPQNISSVLFKVLESWMELMATDGVRFEHVEKVDGRRLLFYEESKMRTMLLRYIR
jgi:hypothetical protein